MAFVRRHYQLLVLIILAVVFGPLLFGGRVSAAPAYVQDELIDDSVFLDANTMNANQIQAFLTNIGSGLATFTTTEGTGGQTYYPNYGQIVSAAQLIYDAGQVYGINPQAIMATLQKEQSLITDPSPTASQLNFAMGYGCADSTGCGSDAGFFNQIDNATWQLRFDYERAAGNDSWWGSNTQYPYPCADSSRYYAPGLFPGNNVTFYDDSGTAYDSFTIQNASTAALYCYTPHAYPGSSQEYYSGSYNFVISFEEWFGSTIGSLIRTSTDPTLYYSDGISRYLVGSMDMAGQYNLGLGNVRIVSQADLDAVPLASSPDTPNLSYVVKSDANNDNGTIYLVNDGIRYPIGSMTQFYNFGFTLSQLGYMPLNDLQRMPVGPYLSDFINGSDGFVYEVDSNIRNGIFSQTLLSQLDPSMNVTPLSSLVIDNIPLGLAQLSGNSVMIDPNGNVYMVNNTTGTWYYITSNDQYYCLGLQNLPNIYYSYSQTTVGTVSNNVSCLVQTSGGQDYIMDDWRIIPVNPSWGFTNFDQIGDSFITSLPVYNPTSTPLFASPGSGQLYEFINGKKDQIINMTSFNNNGYTPNDILTLSTNVLNTIPTGPSVLSSGMIVQDPSTGNLYVISGNSKLYITSMTEFYNYGFNPANIITLDPLTLAAYTTSGNLAPMANVPTPTLFDSGRAMQASTSALQTDYGFSGSTPTYAAGVAGSVSATQQLTPFVKFVSSPTLYYMQNGELEPIGNMAILTALGGNTGDLTILSNAAESLFPLGPNAP